MDCAEAYTLIERAFAAQRLANAYLLVGGVRGMAGALAQRIMHLLFGPETNLATHPDIHRVEPEKKTRIISVEAMRTEIMGAFELQSYSGGWRVGIINNVECMHSEAANTFLKILEEPPPRTLFLLLCEAPERLLPTIISRCHIINLDDVCHPRLAEPFRGKLLQILARDNLNTVTGKAAAAARMTGILEEIQVLAAEEIAAERESAAEEGPADTKEQREAKVAARYREYRQNFFQTLRAFFRDMMVVKEAMEAPLENPELREVLARRAAKMQRVALFRNLEAVEQLVVSMNDRNIKEWPALAFFCDRVLFCP